MGSIVARTVFIVSDLSLVGLACGNDAQNVISWRVDHDEKTLFDLSQELIALFAVAAARVGLNQAIRIEKNSCRVGEVETTLTETSVTPGLAPFEIHG